MTTTISESPPWQCQVPLAVEVFTSLGSSEWCAGQWQRPRSAHLQGKRKLWIGTVKPMVLLSFSSRKKSLSFDTSSFAASLRAMRVASSSVSKLSLLSQRSCVECSRHVPSAAPNLW